MSIPSVNPPPMYATLQHHIRLMWCCTLVPKLEIYPFSRILSEKNTPFSTEIADFEVL